MSRRWLWVLVLVSASVVVAPDRPAVAKRYSAPAFSTRWMLVWSDEFNGPAGRSPDPATWSFDTGNGAANFGNQEWEYYTSRRSNVALDGHGHLAITARREILPGMAHCAYGTCDITSGRITTARSFNWTYGRFEARMRVPYGQGTWPAFWMLGDTVGQPGWPASGEIDIMEEVGSDPRTVYGTIHGPGFVDNGIERQISLPGREVLADRFHTYAVEWSPRAITWTLDGKPYGTVHRSALASNQRWVFDHGFYLLLNLAIGGAMPGPPDAQTPFPSTLLVDSVRVYKAVAVGGTNAAR